MKISIIIPKWPEGSIWSGFAFRFPYLSATTLATLTTYPGTKVFSRMMAENSILTTDWSKYDMAHVVYKPKSMSPEELQDGYLQANREVYSWRSMLKRLPAFRRSLQVFGPMNWGFRKAWKEFRY